MTTCGFAVNKETRWHMEFVSIHSYILVPRRYHCVVYFAIGEYPCIRKINANALFRRGS